MTLVIAGCDRAAADAQGPRKASAESEVLKDRQFRDFKPGNDRQAVELYREVLARPESTAGRIALAEHYQAVGYVALAAFVRKGISVSEGQELRSVHLPSSNVTWSCPESDDAAYAVVDRIDERLNASDFVGAYKLAQEVAGGAETACPVLVEAGVAIIAASIAGVDVPLEEFERAARTIVTADVEMQLPHYAGSREWPYQLLADAFLARGDAASSLVASQLAIQHLDTRTQAGNPPSEATKRHINRLIERARLQLQSYRKTS